MIMQDSLLEIKCEYLVDNLLMCNAGAELGLYICSKQDEETCQWAKEREEKDENTNNR